MSGILHVFLFFIFAAQQGLSCRGLAAEMGQSKSSAAGKANGSLHWQQADLVWLYRMKGLPSDFALGNDAALVNRLLSPPAKEVPRTRKPIAKGHRSRCGTSSWTATIPPRTSRRSPGTWTR